jgi:hypothetical protein
MKSLRFVLRRYRSRVLLALIAVVAVVAGATDKSPFRPNEKAAFADPHTISFVRPGLTVRVDSAEISADGTISVVFTLADPRGLPLDREGISTPGSVALSFVAAHIPQGLQQYVAYTTRMATGGGRTVTQAAADTGGTFTKVAEGQYRYVFRTRAPSGYDRLATHTIGIYGSSRMRKND